MQLSLADSLLDKAKAAYLGLAAGDALGATVEFMTPGEISAQLGIHQEITGGGWLKLKPGQITDDTGMSLALGDSILSCESIDSVSIAEAFSLWMKSKPVDIGNTVRRGIVHYRHSGETSVPKNDYNAGNGACMRTLPIALATYGADWDAIVTASRVQSHITHHCEESDVGTEHVIDLIHMSLDSYSKSELENYSLQFVESFGQFGFEKRIEQPGGYIVDTLKAVLNAFYTTDTFEDCLVDVVNRGGDADTTGAIAGMIAGAFYGTTAIPKRWLRQLDKNIYNQCVEQAEALIMLAPLSSHVEKYKQYSSDANGDDKSLARYSG